MATFGRTKLMAVAIKRFLTQLQRHDSDAYTVLPEDFRNRYTPVQSRLFADAKDADALRTQPSASRRRPPLHHHPLRRSTRPHQSIDL